MIVITACSYIPDTKQYKQSANWAQAVKLLTDINEQSADFAELANRLALQTNLNLQFDLGGRPEIHFPLLFSRSDREIRQSLHQNLQLYADNILQALAQTQEAAVPADILNFKPLSAAGSSDIKALERLPDAQITGLSEKLSGFSVYFYYPKTVKELATLTLSVREDIERISFLFYLDLGGVTNSVTGCAAGKLPLVEPINLAQLPECRNGVRALVNEALGHVIKTWRMRLKLALPKELKEAKEWPALIDRIYQMDRLKEDVDLALHQVRSAAVALAGAHNSLSVSLAMASGVPIEPTKFLVLEQSSVPQGDLRHSLQELRVRLGKLRLKLLDLLKGEINEI